MEKFYHSKLLKSTYFEQLDFNEYFQNSNNRKWYNLYYKHIFCDLTFYTIATLKV